MDGSHKNNVEQKETKAHAIEFNLYKVQIELSNSLCY